MAESSPIENKSFSEENALSSLLDDSSVTMLDVLKQEQELEGVYAAVLGGSDEKRCTYPKGYIKRQALYSCLTCCPESRTDVEKSAGICLACSYNCHENHELVELYTKRNFRCDCPTERIPGQKCTLDETVLSNGKKHAINNDNSYNHNFSGLYCTCERPYPDPENISDDIMLQCAVCEDWFHLQHLNTSKDMPNDADYEVVCEICMRNHEFLQDYIGLAIVHNGSDIDGAGEVSVTDDKLKSDLDKSISEIMNISSEDLTDAGGSANDESMINSASVNETKIDIDIEKSVKEKDADEPAAKRVKIDETEKPNECKRPVIKTNWEKGATFWPNELHSLLCKCSTCMTMYAEQKVTFLLDPEDSAKSYEERGIKRAATESSTYEQGIRALSSIGRTQQIDAIVEYNRMKDKLMKYLQTFVVSKKVVTEDDINRFFETMRNEKRSNVGEQQFYCR